MASRSSSASPSADSRSKHGSDKSISLDIIESEEELFCVQDVHLKGKGLVAIRPISRGELLLAESPLFILSPSPSNSTILAALSQCKREEQSQFFALCNAFKGRRLPALGIFESNALHFTDHDPQQNALHDVAGLFVLGSRFNSSCRPNVSKTWDPVMGVMLFRTMRDVEEGEELCFNYVDVLDTKEQRQNSILELRNFTCRCNACELQGEDAVESDRRRTTVARLFDEVAVCGNEPTLGMRKIKIALKLLKEEQLVHYAASFCYDAFQFCVLVSDFSNAKKWIRQAWEISCWTSGPDSDAARMFKMYWANPRTHSFAGALPKAVLGGPDPS